MEYTLGKEGLAAALQKLLAQNGANQRASLGALQQMDSMGSSYTMRADANYQQQAFPATVNRPMPHSVQKQQRLEDARRALQAALVNWHACYQEVRLGQPMVPGPAPINGQMVDQLSKLMSHSQFPVVLPPGLGPPEANTPSTLSPSSGLGSPYVNEVAHPRYAPVAGGQFSSKAQTTQREPQKNTKVPEEVCAAAGSDSYKAYKPYETETLRTHLQALLKFEASCILIVRKINRLGFDSAQVLKEHFSLQGTVLEVYVAHSRVKPTNWRQSLGSRWRPSGIGFVVMSRADEAAAILNQGGEQDICGCAIRVQKFERRAAMDSLEKEEEKQHNVQGLCERDEGSESRLLGA